MSKVDFSKIATKYEEVSLSKIQKPVILIGLIDIRNSDDILDLGCGTGHLTRKLRELTNGRIVGVDPAEGMIKEQEIFLLTLENLGFFLKQAMNIESCLKNMDLGWFYLK
jgi:ubiquinone/menaquinone biosynthesis C-methylase UbiE